MNPMEIKTSVIIPVYNTKEYLEICIESVLKQTQNDIEIILVDDGSTDGSRDIIEVYDKKYSFVKAIYQENKKLGAARNRGVEEASGKYIYFLDSDDYIHENLLDECYQIAEKKQLDFVMFDGKTFVDEEESKLRAGSAKEIYDRSDMQIGDRIYSGIEFWNKYYSRRGVYPNAYLVYINTDFLIKNKLFFEPGVYYEDNDWIVRMYFKAKRICYIPQQLYFRRFRAGSIMTVNYQEIHLKSCILLCRKMMDILRNIQKAAIQEMVIPVLEMMLWRFKEILEYCSKNQVLDRSFSELLEFYKSLLDNYEKVDLKETYIQKVYIAVADTIKREVQKSEVQIRVPDLGLEEYKKDVIEKECQKYELHKNGKIVGIYGTGLVCDRFLYLYQKYVGQIQASVFFIDTYAKTGGYYRGFPLYNIEDIGMKKIDTIIIASTRYREIMEKNVMERIPELAEKTELSYISEVVKSFMRLSDLTYGDLPE